MTSATVGGTATTYTYSGDGLRDTATTAGVTTTYTWDVNGSLPQVLDDGASQYIYGLGGTPIEQVSSSGSIYYLPDGLGSVMATTDASGNVVDTYTYDPYRETTSSTGSQPNPFQFAGQETDPTGLQYLRARYYDPETGSFLSQDPLGVSPAWPGNPFGYADGNPTTLVDPYGLFGLPGWAKSGAEKVDGFAKDRASAVKILLFGGRSPASQLSQRWMCPASRSPLVVSRVAESCVQPQRPTTLWCSCLGHTLACAWSQAPTSLACQSPD